MQQTLSPCFSRVARPPYSPLARDDQPLQHEVCKQPWSLGAMNAEPMLGAGLAVQADRNDAVRSRMSVLAKCCSALQCAAAAHRRYQRDSLHMSCVTAVAV